MGWRGRLVGVGKEQSSGGQPSDWIGLASQMERRREIAGLQIPKKGNSTDADTRLQLLSQTTDHRPQTTDPFWVRIRRRMEMEMGRRVRDAVTD